MANVPEFHPVGEYGGRRFRVATTPVGRVPGDGERVRNLADSDAEDVKSAGYESPTAYAIAEATKFAPVRGSPGAKAGPTGAVSEILESSVSEDGKYYYYEFRTESVYPFRFWGVSAIGPGQIGGARKLKRRDVVSVVCQMPEDKAQPGDYDLFRAIVKNFRVDDF